MLYTYTGTHGHTFEIVAVFRHLTPIASLVSLEALVYDKTCKEVAKTRMNQVPMDFRFYEFSTTYYPECRVHSSNYSADHLEACESFAKVFLTTEDAKYPLRAP